MDNKLSRCQGSDTEMPRVVDAQLLSEVARRILMVVQPDHIIFFGCAAPGNVTDESDLESLVTKTLNNREERVRISGALRGRERNPSK